MDGYLEILTQGTGLYPWMFLGLCAISFAGSFNRLPERNFRIGLRTVLTLLAFRLLYDAVRAYQG